MRPTPDSLVGSFVVEIGLRQAWYFLTFCDNVPTPPVETRLYVDSDFAITGVPPHTSTFDMLDELNSLAVAEVDVLDDGGLMIVFEGGPTLVVSGRATAETVMEPWWFGVVSE